MSYPTSKLRRIALDAQGLLRGAPFGRGKNATLKAIEQLGYVQIDTISVVARAHHHVLRSRVPNYLPNHLDKLQREGKVFEYWSHAAAYLPMRDFRYALPRMRAMAAGEERWIRSRDRKLMAEVLKRIAYDGPAKARDFDTTSDSKAGWWNWKPAKSALEQLFMQGDLMVVGREGFQKVYDLTERVLPPTTDTTVPDPREMAQYLIDTTLRAHGFATQKSVTYQRRGTGVRALVKSIFDEALDQSNLVSFSLSSGETAYAHPDLLESRAPMAPTSVKLLSPFDNAVIQRERGQAVFGYDYQIECYVTEAKRRYGYFCLPILYQDKLVGRVDCKAHRAERLFEVKSLYVEDERLNRTLDPRFAVALNAAIDEFAEFNGCREIAFSKLYPCAWGTLLGAN